MPRRKRERERCQFTSRKGKRCPNRVDPDDGNKQWCEMHLERAKESGTLGSWLGGGIAGYGLEKLLDEVLARVPPDFIGVVLQALTRMLTDSAIGPGATIFNMLVQEPTVPYVPRGMPSETHDTIAELTKHGVSRATIEALMLSWQSATPERQQQAFRLIRRIRHPHQPQARTGTPSRK